IESLPKAATKLRKPPIAVAATSVRRRRARPDSDGASTDCIMVSQRPGACSLQPPPVPPHDGRSGIKDLLDFGNAVRLRVAPSHAARPFAAASRPHLHRLRSGWTMWRLAFG